MMKRKYIFYIVIVFSAILTFILPSDSSCFAYPFIVGEELTYNVTWLGIHLATVSFQVSDSLQMDDQKVYHLKFFIDSNPLLFFVNNHSRFESYIDENLYPHLYKSLEKDKGNVYEARYRFDYKENLIHIKIIDQDTTTKVLEKSIPLDEYVLDGLSLIFYMRNNLLFPKDKQLSVIAGGEKRRLDLKVLGKGKKLFLKSLNKALDTYEIQGKAHFTSTAGVNGKFRAWFALDEQKPPLTIELKVFIGHVKLTLASWKNWNSSAVELTGL